MVQLRMVDGDSQNEYDPYIYIIDIFPYIFNSVNFIVFGLVKSNAVTNTVTHIFPMYSYKILVIYCSIPPLNFRKREQVKSVI